MPPGARHTDVGELSAIGVDRILGIIGYEDSRLCPPHPVSAHSWRILFTQTLGGMSSMPNWSVLFEICRWSASSAWSLKSRSRRVTAVSAAPRVVVRGRHEVGTSEQRRNVIEDGAQQCMGGVDVAPAVV